MFFAFGFLFFLPLMVLAYYSPGQPTGYVTDGANLFSSQEKNELETKISAFEKETSNEIAIVSIPSLQGDTIENFAVRLFEDWGIGKKEKDNGVLVLISLEDRKMRIEVGYGLEGALTDAQSFWIIDEVMKPAFRENKYYAGVNEAVDKIIAATKGEYVPEKKQSGGINSDWVAWLFFFIFLFIRVLAKILGRSKSWWAGGVIGAVAGLIIGLVAASIIMGLVTAIILTLFGLLFDYLVSRSFSKAKEQGRNPWWFFGGGSGHGGHSGGFGGFGGGGSGGGGSSGGW